MSETIPAPSNTSQSNTPQNTAAAAKLPGAAEQHEKAARGHEMAAALHHEAARFYADGDEENAMECAKQALTHGRRANEPAAQLSQQPTNLTTH